MFHSTNSTEQINQTNLKDSNKKLSSYGKFPPLNNMILDRSKFQRLIPMIIVGLSCDKQLKSTVEKLRPYFSNYIRLPKLSRTYTDSNGLLRKLMLIQTPVSNPLNNWLADLKQWNIDVPNDLTNSLTIDLTKISESINLLVGNSQDNNNNNPIELIDKPCFINVGISYANFTLEQIFKELLPEIVQPLSGFTVIGHVVQFNLRPEALPYRHIIGQVALDKIPNIRTVVHKASVIESAYRTFEMDLLAGQPEYVTCMRENGVTFHLDISKVYWNPRLGTEHTRIVNSIQPVLPPDNLSINSKLMPANQIVVYDVFAGIGPFAIPAARLGCSHVFANDLNPDSYKWLMKNITINSSRKHPLNNITCYNMDGRQFIREIVLPHYWSEMSKSEQSNLNEKNINSIKRFVIIMNLPLLAPDFLDTFSYSILKNFDQIINFDQLIPLQFYCYLFLKRNTETELHVKQRLARAFNMTNTDSEQEIDLLFDNTNNKFTCLQNWNLRYVRNVAPYKDMYCAEFQLYIQPFDQQLNMDSSSPLIKRAKIENKFD